MSDVTGLLVDETPEIQQSHQDVIAGLRETPVSFAVKDTSNLPPQWWSEIDPKDQGSFSCCVGGGLSGCTEHRNLIETGELVRHSMFHAYLIAQKECGMLGRDNGATLAGAMRAAAKYGLALDSLFPMPQRYTTQIPVAAVNDAAAHKYLGDVGWDARALPKCIDWLTNKDPILLGWLWTSGLANLTKDNWIITAKTIKTGPRMGYHCEQLCGWYTLDGELCPVIRNTHGRRYGRNGLAVFAQDAWEYAMRDPNTVALAYGDFSQRVPERKNWDDFNWAGGGVPSWVGGQS